jgi:thioredoxin
MEALNDNTFAEALVAYPGLVVDFWAPWCGPCRVLAPVLEGLAEDAPPGLLFARINVDEQSALAARFDIRSIPTLLFFKDGELVDRLVGAVPAAEIAARVEALQE